MRLYKSDQLNFHYFDSVNFTDVNDIIVPMSVKKEFKDMILKFRPLTRH